MSINQKTHLLYLCQSGAQAQIQQVLEENGLDFEFSVVASTQEFPKRLATGDIDLVLCDYPLKEGNISSILNISQMFWFVVLLTDADNEKGALDIMEKGLAADYVLREESQLKRLPYVLKNVLLKTERRVTEVDRQRFKRILEGGFESVVIVGENGKLEFVVEQITDDLGYSRREVDQSIGLDFIHPDDFSRAVYLFDKLRSNPESEVVDRIRVIHKNRSWHWVEVYARNMLSDPLVRGFIVRYRDVTKRKQDEILQEAVYRIAQAADRTESLDELYPLIHLIITEVMPAENFFIALYSAETNQVEYPYFMDEKDRPPEGTQLLEEKSLTAYVLRTGASLLCDKETSKRLETAGEVELVGSDSAIWLGVPLLVEKIPLGVLVVQHYTDGNAYGEREQRILEFVSSQVAMVIYRKQAEARLRESEERFRSLFENATSGIYRSTPGGHVLLANSALFQITGYSSLSDLQSIDLTEKGYANANDRQAFLRLLEDKGEIRGYESVWRKKDGSPIYVRESAHFIIDEQTGERFIEGIVEDVTERKKAEVALQEKVKTLQTLSEIDREILATERADNLMELVCRRAAELLKAPKACIAFFDEKGARLAALYGFNDPESVKTEFAESANLGIFKRGFSFSIGSLEIDRFPRLMPETRKCEDIHSVMAESFFAKNGLRAILLVYDVKPRDWTTDDTQLLKFLVGQIALSLERTKLLEDAEYRAQNFETLYSITGDLATRRDLQSVLDVIVESAMKLFNAAVGTVYLYDESRDVLNLTWLRGLKMPLGLTVKMGEGMAGRVAQSRKPMVVDNYQGWDERLQVLNDANLYAVMEVPMLYGGQLIGVLAISEVRQANRVFTEDETRLLSLFAGQAASAVYNARLFSNIRQRNQELDRLYRALGRLIAGLSSDLTGLCNEIAEIVTSEFEHANCSVWLLDENDPSHVQRCGEAGNYEFVIPRGELSLDGSGLIPKAVRMQQTINVGNVQKDRDYLLSWEDAQSELVIPLFVEDRILGALDLQSVEANAFQENDVQLMVLFASRIALMIEHVRLVEQTEERVKRLDTLHAIDAAVASSLDLRITLSTLLEQVISRLSADAVSVLLVSPHLQVLEYSAGRGFRTSGIERYNVRIGEGFSGRAALEHNVIYVSNLTQPEAVLRYPERISGEGFVSAFAIPLVSKGQVRGVLELYYRRLFYSNFEWIEFLETLARQIAVAIESNTMFEQLQRTVMELQLTQDASAEGWARLLELRNIEPPGHIQRTIDLTVEIAIRMGFNEAELANIYRGVLLHDIGKLAIPESIIKKPGPLTPVEWELVKQHPAFAHEILFPISHLRTAVDIPYCHHELWDGSGYPRGLKGEQIPLTARIFNLVETWDLMRLDLPYRSAHSETEVLEYIRSQSGKRFDPRVLDFFFEVALKDLNHSI